MYPIDLVAGPVFDLSLKEGLTIVSVLAVTIYLFAFLTPAILVAAIFNKLRNVGQPRRKKVYKHLILLFTAAFVSFFILTFVTWNYSADLWFRLLLLFWLATLAVVLKRLDGQK